MARTYSSKGYLLMTRTVLIIGSAPDATRARHLDSSCLAAIVAINNAWRIRSDWTHLVHPGDFPDVGKPTAGPGQSILSYEDYVPANNSFGGVVYTGGTMAFSTAYWALDQLRPDVMAFCGCDMIYDQKNGRSHFYGQGRADPLRPDPTLQSLEAKSNRLMLLAADEGCLCVNLSELPRSRLTFPRLHIQRLGDDLGAAHSEFLKSIDGRIDRAAMKRALTWETNIGMIAPGGDYWNHLELLDPSAISAIDGFWLSSFHLDHACPTEPSSTSSTRICRGSRHHSIAVPSYAKKPPDCCGERQSRA